ncbi:MAG: hypothetical protein MI921_11680 [Cytophagales bacterium]|nr:hypothetical protein [Cytophagales bacterium]
MQPSKRKCLACGCQIQGRADKKFCAEQCRNNHYNQLNRDANLHVRNVNNILRKNRRILATLNPTGSGKVHRDRLLIQGFDFEHFTNCHRTRLGTIYYCYEQGYMTIDNGFVILKTKMVRTA